MSREPIRGYAWHGQLDDGRATGVLTFTDSHLRFSSDEVIVDMPLDGLEIRAGGTNDAMVFFAHPDSGGWTVATEDSRLFAVPELRKRGELRRQLRAVRGKRRWLRITLAAAVIAVVIPLAALLFFRREVADLAASRIPPVIEEEASRKITASLRESHRFCDDPQILLDLHRVAAPVLAGGEESPYVIEVQIVDDPAINAWAVPGGPVVVNSGLILAAETPGEVAAVIAHEVGHVELRHTVRNLVRTAGDAAILSFLIGDVEGFVDLAVTSSHALLHLSYSREFELEADQFAYHRLHEVGVDPAHLERFFVRLQRAARAAGVDAEPGMTFLSSHPLTEDRISALRELEGKTNRFSRPAAYSGDFRDFQERVDRWARR